MLTTVASCDQLQVNRESYVAGRIPEALSGGESALSMLAPEFERLHAVVFRYLMHCFFDPELAEELTARTFYLAARAVRRLPMDDDQLRFWLLRTATNVANTHLRRTRVRQFVLRQLGRLRPMATKTESAFETEDDHRVVVIRGAVQALRPKLQAVVVMRYYSHMSFAEIASVLHCRENAVRTRLSRAVKEMRLRLNALSSDDQGKSQLGGCESCTNRN